MFFVVSQWMRFVMSKPEIVRFGMPQTMPTQRENLVYARVIADCLCKDYGATRILAVTESVVTAEFDDADDALEAAIDLDANDRLEPDPEQPGQARLSSASLWGDDAETEQTILEMSEMAEQANEENPDMPPLPVAYPKHVRRRH